jgi:hypothetical protein
MIQTGSMRVGSSFPLSPLMSALSLNPSRTTPFAWPGRHDEHAFPTLFVDNLSLSLSLSGITINYHHIASSYRFCCVFRQARVVELRGNGLTRIDDVFVACEQLEHLDLGHNLLTSLPPLHLSLGNVTTLILAHNQLTSTQGLERLYSLTEVGVRLLCCSVLFSPPPHTHAHRVFPVSFSFLFFSFPFPFLSKREFESYGTIR